jgi:low affinity Fe/Cu permease
MPANDCVGSACLVRTGEGRAYGEEAASGFPTVEERRSRGSRLLWGVDRWTGAPLTAVSVLAAGIAWVALSAVFDFPDQWERIFQTLVAAITVVMVFVIQHTQARHQAATQRKLDEILRVLPEADNSLLALEHASDDELRAAHQQHQQIRQTALQELEDDVSQPDRAR